MWLLSAIVHGIKKNQFRPQSPKDTIERKRTVWLGEWTEHRLLWMARLKKKRLCCFEIHLFRKPAQNNAELHLKPDRGYSHSISPTSNHEGAPLLDAQKV